MTARAPGLVADLRVVRGGFSLEVAVQVQPGEILAVLGPNGAGKTTFLRTLAGLAAASSGRLAVGGDVWDDASAGVFVPAVDRAAALVFQDYRLFPHLSVLDNVAFAARSAGERRAPARAHAAAVLERLGLVELASRRPRALSGGQAQRVALARALAAGPRLLLLDEPLAALDVRTRLEIRGELRSWLAGFDGPTVLVTHDPLEAMVLADRILVLEAGRVVQEGTPAQVSRRPVTEYVARLVGLNLYRGTLEDATSHRVLLDGGGALVAAGSAQTGTGAPGGTPPPRGSRMLVAVPPTTVSLHVVQPDASSVRNTWTGVVAGLELLTDRVRVAVDGPPDAVVDITPAALADLGLHPGTPVWLTVKATEVVAYREPGTPTS